ncbi:uncharacterized protein [Venturia canescens]|uniref:uncharacterized protein n=1 Tax=Venturia canescens TaxID=32260 RepID=UPI001C9BE5BC|nr:uncharacterized protein LOC122407016 [Venturia canescens]
MDVQILRAIVQSRSEVMKEVEDPDKFERSLAEEKFPPLDRSIFTILTRCFTDLFSHKVSPEAHQRYSVRIQLIEVLRDWIRPCSLLNCSRTFYKGEKVLDFTERMLKIYLTSELLYQEDGNIQTLVDVAKALLCLIPRRKSLVSDFERILERICELEPTADSESLLIEILEGKDRPVLSSKMIENLYIAQRVKLIETPIVESLLENLKNGSSLHLRSKCSRSMVNVLKKCVDSPAIFHISCSILKQLFVCLKYSQRVLRYIKDYLETLDSLCQERHKNILDLYPLRAQALVILLRISPNYHSSCSRDHTIKSLMKTHEINPEETLILITHFPDWLTLFTNRLTKYCEIEKSEIFGNADSFQTSRSVSPMIIDID